MEEILNIAKGRVGPASGNGPPGGMPDLGKLLGEDFGGMDPKQLAQQAQSLLKQLDDMAENDEEAYIKFIKQQADAAAAMSQQQRQAASAAASADHAAMQKLVQGIQPAMVLELPMLVPGPAGQPGAAKAVLQIWSASKASKVAPATVGSGTPVKASTSTWEGLQVPLLQCRPPSQHRPQPSKQVVPGGHLPVRTFYIAANPDTVELAMLGSPPQLRLLLAAAACQFVESKHGVQLQRQAWRVMVNPVLLSDSERAKVQADAEARSLSRSSAGADPTGSLPQTLLDQLSSLGHPNHHAGPRQGSRAEGLAAAGSSSLAASGGGSGPARRPLIVEMGPANPEGTPGAGLQDAGVAPTLPAAAAAEPAATGTGAVLAPASQPVHAAAPMSAQPSTSGPAVRQTTAQPSAHLEQSNLVVSLEGPPGPGQQVVVQAYLAAASRASDVDMDAHGGCLLLRVAGQELSVQLPCTVDEEAAKAKFDTKRRMLTVRFPCR